MLASVQIPLLLGAVFVAMLSFSIEKIPAEVTALGLLLFLVLADLLPVQEAFAGFSSDVVIMMLVRRHRVPDRVPPDEFEDIRSQLYLSEILIPEGSFLAGKTLHGAGLGRDLDLKVLRIVRERTRYVVPQEATQLKEGDVLLVEGEPEDILRVEDRADVDIRAEVKFALPDLETEDIALREVILLPGSPLIGRKYRSLKTFFKKVAGEAGPICPACGSPLEDSEGPVVCRKCGYRQIDA